MNVMEDICIIYSTFLYYLTLKLLHSNRLNLNVLNKLRLIIMIKYVHNKIYNNNVMSLRRLRVNVRKNHGKNTPSNLHQKGSINGAQK